MKNPEGAPVCACGYQSMGACSSQVFRVEDFPAYNSHFGSFGTRTVNRLVATIYGIPLFVLGGLLFLIDARLGWFPGAQYPLVVAGYLVVGIGMSGVIGAWWARSLLPIALREGSGRSVGTVLH